MFSSRYYTSVNSALMVMQYNTSSHQGLNNFISMLVHGADAFAQGMICKATEEI
jgi:hypothetical protein